MLPVYSWFQRPGSFLTPTLVRSCVVQWEAYSIHSPPEPLVVQMNALMVQRGAVDEGVNLITAVLCLCKHVIGKGLPANAPSNPTS